MSVMSKKKTGNFTVEDLVCNRIAKRVVRSLTKRFTKKTRAFVTSKILLGIDDVRSGLEVSRKESRAWTVGKFSILPLCSGTIVLEQRRLLTSVF